MFIDVFTTSSECLRFLLPPEDNGHSPQTLKETVEELHCTILLLQDVKFAN